MGLDHPKAVLDERVEHEVTRNVRGVGLGLAVCQRIIEAHGGHIWVESDLGRGSTFHVVLPNGEKSDARVMSTLVAGG